MNAQNCLVTCIDFRFHKPLHEWLIKSGFMGNTDIISIAGSSKDLVKPLKLEFKESFLRELETSIKLHNPKNIVIVDHENCGGYAQDGTIPFDASHKIDADTHAIYSQKAKEILNKLYPDKNISCFYIDMKGVMTQYA